MTSITSPINPPATLDIHMGRTHGTTDLVVFDRRYQGSRVGDNWGTAVDPADLKAALEQELGWTIVTEPLPEGVIQSPGGGPFYGPLGGDPWSEGTGYHAKSPEDARRHARNFLAIARHLEQHPPVDPAVERLAEILVEEHGPLAFSTELAKALIKRGVKVPE